jgi:hypothetical protein
MAEASAKSVQRSIGDAIAAHGKVVQAARDAATAAKSPPAEPAKGGAK